jgi:hypothetical protein
MQKDASSAVRLTPQAAVEVPKLASEFGANPILLSLQLHLLSGLQRCTG